MKGAWALTVAPVALHNLPNIHKQYGAKEEVYIGSGGCG